MPEYESPPSSLKPGSIVVAYLRDSGHENQELSVAQQEAAIRDWCAKYQLSVERIYKDEARRGSTDTDRDALDEMMNSLRHNAKVAGVVVWSNSRFARNTVHAQFYRAEIRKLGYIFHSITDKVTASPESIIFEALIDYKNQQYLHDMSIDVKRGLRQLVEQFGCVLGVPPTGFKREQVIIGEHRDGKLRVVHTVFFFLQKASVAWQQSYYQHFPYRPFYLTKICNNFVFHLEAFHLCYFDYVKA